MLNIKFQFLIIILCYVYTVFSETSFIPKGQRAEIFELTDNEVPVFRVTLPDSEFLALKEAAKDKEDLTLLVYSINNTTKSFVDTINSQNLFEAFPNSNLSELLPELPINENGYSNIDSTKFYVDESYLENKEFTILVEILNVIYNDNSYLNLFKVVYVLSEQEMSPDVDTEFKEFILDLKSVLIIDENGNYVISMEKLMEKADNPKESSLVDDVNEYIKYIIDLFNSQNLLEVFPNANFTEILPELPMTKEGYLNIDYTKYLVNEDDLQKFDEDESDIFIILEIFNDDSYLNLIKINYVLSELEMSSNVDEDFSYFLSLIRRYTEIDENGYFKINKSNFQNTRYKYYQMFKNVSTKELYELIKNYNINDIREINDNYYKKDFKTKNATMIVELNNQKLPFDKITFSIGGQYSSTFPRPGFNVKIRGNKELFGRRQFKLRADASEPSYMRTKLMCDIHDRLGIPSLSANYATLYINDEYMGLYILTDAFKESWIEYVYGEKDTTQLYKSESAVLIFGNRQGFKNENNEITDDEELYKFLAVMTKASKASDVESIFDLDQFYKEVAISFLTYGWDHIRHNYYLYKNPQNGKWIYYIQDFDFDLGVELNGIKNMKKDITKFDFKDMEYPSNINKIISSDNQRFNEILKEIVINVFNPETLFPRIDELKTYIEPYIKLDKTPNDNGEYPGVINKNRSNMNYFFTFKEWEGSTEYGITKYQYYGLKEFILLRYRYICESYDIECDPKYLDENIELPTNKTEISVENEPTPVVSTPVTTLITTPVIEVTPTQTSVISDSTPTPETSSSINCYAEIIGYSCCPSGITTIYATDEYGDWSYDFSKEEWCGLTKYEVIISEENNDECWSEALGYPCCKGCKVYETDSNGSWGYEIDHWCGIKPSQCQK